MLEDGAGRRQEGQKLVLSSAALMFVRHARSTLGAQVLVDNL
jgi:hypothetical protein